MRKRVGWVRLESGVVSLVAAFIATAACQVDRSSSPTPAETQVVRGALNAAPKSSDFIFEAGSSIVLHSAPLCVNGGDVGARGTGSGPFLSGGVAIDIASGVTVQTTHNIIADSIRLNSGIKVGDLQTNRLVNPSSGTHGKVSALVPLPALPALAAVAPGTQNLTVAGGKTVTASPGQYLTVSLGTKAVLRLPAGAYQMKDLTIGTSGRVEALGPVTILIANRLNAGSSFFLGPASGCTNTAKNMRIEVSGQNGTDGALGSTPKAASLGSDGSVRALMLVPNGTLSLASNIQGKGAFMAHDIDVGSAGASYQFEDGFPNAAGCTAQSCDDHNACTTDVCGSNGVCTHGNVAAGTSCGDGNACNGAEVCNAAGACQAGTPVTCAASDQCHAAGTCNPATGVCSNPAKADGTTCDDGNPCTVSEACHAGACGGGGPKSCPSSDPCKVATCDGATGACVLAAAPDGTTCNDGSACTTADSCQGGSCTGTPRTCTASDQCHVAGTCDPSSGLCSNPAAADGTSCNDGKSCTAGDVCVSGICAGAVACAATDQCHVAGTCDGTGACTNPAKADGTSCNDGKSCTAGDVCTGGTCAGAVACAATDQCHTAGTCDGTGACTNPTKADGTTCDDGKSCTASDVCTGGTCAGTVACAATDQCHVAGTCDGTGACTNPTKADGTTCNDGKSCTASDVCTGGTCAGTVACAATDQCHAAGACDGTGACTNPTQVDGTACNDGKACTASDVCTGGTCAGTVACAATDQCHTAGTCDGTGACTNPTKTDGTTCDDGKACTAGDVCTGGTCVGTLACAATDQCHVAGTCDGTGACTNPAKANGTSCSDDNACSRTDTCQEGTCVGSNFVTCVPSDTCHSSACDSGSGTCVETVAVGRSCSDGNPCNGLELCAATGVCTASAPPALDDGNPCTADSCDPALGVAHAPAPEGTSCGTSSACTATGQCADVCAFGAATGSIVGQVVSFNSGASVPAGRYALSYTDGCVQFGSNQWWALNARLNGVGTWYLVGSSSSQQILVMPGTLGFLPGTSTGTGDLNGFQNFNDCVAANLKVPPLVFEHTGGPLGVWLSDPNYGDNIAGPNGRNPAWRLTKLDGCGGQPVACVDRTPQDLAPVVSAGPNQRAALQGSAPPPTFTMKTLSTGFNNPIGIGYHGPSNRMVMSVNYPSGEPHNFDLVNPDGTHQPFSSIHGLTDEVYFTIARNENGGKSLGGFLDGEMLVGTGVPGAIARVSPDGKSIVNPWVQLPGETGLLRGQLYLDRTGLFGGDLIVSTQAGNVWRVTSTGGTTRLASSLPYGDAEALTVVPNDPTRYGPWAGKILVGDENNSAFTAIDASGTKTTYNLGYGIENAMIVPPNENLFGVDFGTAQLLGASASQFTAMVGDILVTQEFGGGVVDLKWNGTSFDQTVIFRANQWEHVAFGPAGIAQVLPAGIVLAGAVNDDGCPEGAMVSSQWTVLSGPAPVTFADDRAPTTSAVFSAVGTYILRLTATDGVLTSTSDTTVIVSQTGQPNQAPVVNAGPNQTVRLPASVDLAGAASDDGQPSGALNVAWSQVSGPSAATIINASSAFTSVLFTDPGTYVFQLTATDGQLSSSATTTVTVAAEPSLVGASLGVALAAAGPLAIGSNESLIATLTDSGGHVVSDMPIGFTVTGANPQTGTVLTDAAGMATFTYTGINFGADDLSAETLGTVEVDSSVLTVFWETGSTSPALTQGWIGAPVHQSTVTGQVPITVGPGETLTSGTVTYWPMSAPGQVHTLATGVSGDPGATLATLDTTVLANGPWIIQLDATNSSNQEQVSLVAVTVTGSYKPGRVVVEVTDLKVPLPGLSLTVGRRYDSLEKDNVGDFGHGWSLAVGHPRLETDPAHNVALTMPDGRRVTFRFQALSYGGIFRYLLAPSYLPEPGVYGSLTSDGCPLLIINGNQLVCFLDAGLEYVPTTYTYTDRYGVQYVMGAGGELRSIQDPQQDSLTFTPNGIESNVPNMKVVFTRDAAGRITKILGPVWGSSQDEYDYSYDANGNLTSVTMPPSARGPRVARYGYVDRLLVENTDPRGNPSRRETYDTNGRLATDTDVFGNIYHHSYDVAGHADDTTLPNGGVVHRTFDNDGLLLSRTDPLGNKTTYTYNDSWRVLSETNALGETATYDYDARGNRTSLTNARGESIHTTYDKFSHPVTTFDPTGWMTAADYDSRGVATAYRDAAGLIASQTTSQHGLPLVVTNASGDQITLAYDSSGNMTSRTDQNGATTTFQYDEVGHKVGEKDPNGGLTQFSYDRNGNVVEQIDAEGNHHTWTYDENNNVLQDKTAQRTLVNEYDAANNVTRTVYSDGTEVRRTWDFRGNKLTETDQGGRTTSFSYDLNGRLVLTTFADGTTTSGTYDALNRPTSTTNELGQATTFEYQPGCGCVNRRTKVTDPLGRSTLFGYDSTGVLASKTDAAGHQTLFRHDGRGHLLEKDYADGTKEQFAYDALGNRTSYTDQAAAVIQYGYDPAGDLTSVTDALGEMTRYSYDGNSNVLSIADANRHVVTLAYDHLNREVKRILPAGMFEAFEYDVAGNMTAHVDFRGKRTAYSYDTRDHQLTKVPDPTLSEPGVSFTYNPSGTRATMADASGTTSYAYDSRDRLLTKAAPAGVLTYGYDAAGELQSIQSSNVGGTSVKYAWDDAGELVSVTDAQTGDSTNVTYDPTGRAHHIAHPNSVDVTYAYDVMNRVSSLAWGRGGTSSLASWNYTFNERGQRLTSTDGTGRRASYSYDAAARLVGEAVTGDPMGASGDGAITYALDSVGNQTARMSSLAALPAATYSYDANDQITSDTYDPNGSTTASRGHSFAYDFEGRLVSKDAGAVTITYDGDGNRVAKTMGGITTKYLVDDRNPTGYVQVLEEVGAAGVQTIYTYGRRIVSFTRSSSSGSQKSFYGFDARGNITFLTDATGAVTDSYDYDAWGNLVARAGTTDNRRLFSGEELDPDLGLIVMRARYYDPGRGRFHTLDPEQGRVESPRTLNRYVYANGDPVNAVDPDGRDALEYLGVLIFGEEEVNQAAGFILESEETAAEVMMSSQEHSESEGESDDGDKPPLEIIARTAEMYHLMYRGLSILQEGVEPTMIGLGLLLTCEYQLASGDTGAPCIQIKLPDNFVKALDIIHALQQW